MVGAMGALALSAIVLTGNAGLVGASYDKEADLRYAAEIGLSIGKARLNFDPTTLPDTGYKALLSNYQIKAVDNQPVAGVVVNVYVGPSGSTTGQFGRFASIVSEARDSRGVGFIRRLELVQESFAKFAYWSSSESNNGSTIYFGGGDNLWGPVFSDDVISIASSGASFHDVVSTSKTISGANYGVFSKGYLTGQKQVILPSNTMLAKLSGYATFAGFSFAPASTGDITTTRMRIEFVATDLNANGDSTGVDEGFFKVYESPAGNEPWIRGDYSTSNCGDWHAIGPAGKLKFFPVSVHNNVWFSNLLAKTAANGGGGLTSSAATTEKSASAGTIMGHVNARCYLGGDPHLVAVERIAANYPDTLTRYIGGEDTTFTAVGAKGTWRQFTATPLAGIAAKRADAKNLFPIYRGTNPNSKGVIYASGTVGLSGVLRGKITLYATGSIAILDDLRYASDPGLGTCNDILGIISGHDIMIADNAMNTPQNTNGNAQMRMLSATKDMYIHGIMMALSTSFGAENFNTGPSNFSGCEGTTNGRGCLYLTGGIIQVSRGAVGLLSGEGYTKRYSYDHCAVMSPPPYFPTTGKFLDSRYFELDPVNFDIKKLFQSIVPPDK
jgi:hypothetical protein